MQKHLHAARDRAVPTSQDVMDMDPPRHPRVHDLPSSGSVSGPTSMVDSITRYKDPNNERMETSRQGSIVSHDTVFDGLAATGAGASGGAAVGLPRRKQHPSSDIRDGIYLHPPPMGAYFAVLHVASLQHSNVVLSPLCIALSSSGSLALAESRACRISTAAGGVRSAGKKQVGNEQIKR